MDNVITKPRIVIKPWGQEVIWAETELYLGKILEINKGHRLSLQYHNRKDETIYLLSGQLQLDLEHSGIKQSTMLFVGDSFRIKPSVVHRMTAIVDCKVLEASTGEIDDVIRIEDDYKRISLSDIPWVEEMAIHPEAIETEVEPIVKTGFCCCSSYRCCNNPVVINPTHICQSTTCEDCYINYCVSCKEECCCDL